MERIDRCGERMCFERRRASDCIEIKFVDLEALPKLAGARGVRARRRRDRRSRRDAACATHGGLCRLDAARPLRAVAGEYRGRSGPLSRDGFSKANFAGTWIRSNALRLRYAIRADQWRDGRSATAFAANLRRRDCWRFSFAWPTAKAAWLCQRTRRRRCTGCLATGQARRSWSCFGSPYVIKHFPEAKTWLGVFSSADVAQRAAARAIFGQMPIGGRIPVSVPGTVRIGDGHRRSRPIR